MHNRPMALARMDHAKPWYAHIWPWLLMAGPVTVIVAGIYTCWLAFSKPDALVVDDYYKQGKAINQDLRRDRIAAGLGLAANMRYDAAQGKLVGNVLGFGRPIGGKIRIHMVHSTQPAKDIKLQVQPDEQGDFAVALAMLEQAHWQVLIENERRDWRLNGTWAWPAQRTINIKADPVLPG